MDFQSPKLKLKLEAPENIGNLAEKLDENELHTLADHVIELVKIDERSMSEWLGKANGYLDEIDKDGNETCWIASKPERRRSALPSHH
jgi:hypothetical protein